MTRDQWLYDCIEILPKLYDDIISKNFKSGFNRSSVDYEKLYKLIEEHLQDFMTKHQLSTRDILYICDSTYILQNHIHFKAYESNHKNYDFMIKDVFVLADSIFGNDDPETLMLPENINLNESIIHSKQILSKIKKIVFPQNIEYIDPFLDNYSNITTLQFPKDCNLKHISSGAFSNCTKLTTIINFPQKAFIERGAFDRGSPYIMKIIYEESFCPPNLFNAFSIFDQFNCLLSANDILDEYLDYFYSNLDENIDNYFPGGIFLSLIKQGFEHNNEFLIKKLYKYNPSLFLQTIMNDIDSNNDIEFNVYFLDFIHKNNLYITPDFKL